MQASIIILTYTMYLAFINNKFLHLLCIVCVIQFGYFLGLVLILGVADTADSAGSAFILTIVSDKEHLKIEQHNSSNSLFFYGLGNLAHRWNLFRMDTTPFWWTEKHSWQDSYLVFYRLLQHSQTPNHNLWEKHLNRVRSQALFIEYT